MTKRKQQLDDALREQVGIAAGYAHAKKIMDEHDRRMREHRRQLLAEYYAQFEPERYAKLDYQWQV